MQNGSKDLNSATSRKDISVLYEPPNENIVVEADKERILQVVLDIIGNALEFTSEGNVLVSLRSERLQENEGKRIAVVTITDTDCGVDPAIMPRIFEKLSQDQIRVLGWGYSYQRVLYRRMKVKSGSKTIRGERERCYLLFFPTM